MSRDQPRGRWFDQGPNQKRRFEEEWDRNCDREEGFYREGEGGDLRERLSREKFRGDNEGTRFRQAYQEGRNQDQGGQQFGRRGFEQKGNNQGWQYQRGAEQGGQFQRGGEQNWLNQRGGETGWQRIDEQGKQIQRGGNQMGSGLKRDGGSGKGLLLQQDGGGSGYHDVQGQSTKDKAESREDFRGGYRTKELGLCYRCGKEGHHQATCKNLPFCYKCKNEGHMAYQCKGEGESSLLMRGYGFPNMGFFSLKIPGATSKPMNENMGLVQVINGTANCSKIEEEFKNLVDSEWDWKVKQIAESDFLVVFPNKIILTAFSKSKKMVLALHNLEVNVSTADRVSGATSCLETGWVQISRVPDFARTEEAIKLVAELAGEVLVVDELSLIRDGPVRVKIRARNIAKVKGDIEIFIDGEGFPFKFTPELPQKKGSQLIVEQKKKRDDEHSEEEEEDENDRLTEWEKMKKEYDAKQKDSKSMETAKEGKGKTDNKKCSLVLEEDQEGGKVCRELFQSVAEMADIARQEEIDGSRQVRLTEWESAFKNTVCNWTSTDKKESCVLPLSAMTNSGNLLVFTEERVNSQEPPDGDLSQSSEIFADIGNLDSDKEIEVRAGDKSQVEEVVLPSEKDLGKLGSNEVVEEGANMEEESENNDFGPGDTEVSANKNQLKRYPPVKAARQSARLRKEREGDKFTGRASMRTEEDFMSEMENSPEGSGRKIFGREDGDHEALAGAVLAAVQGSGGGRSFIDLAA